MWSTHEKKVYNLKLMNRTQTHYEESEKNPGELAQNYVFICSVAKFTLV